MLACFGLPRTDFSGTIALSWAFVSGFASGSVFAAATIFAFSATDGMRMTRLGVVFDIVLNLFTLGISKADDSSDFTSINKRDVVQRVAFWGKADHSNLVVLVATIDPDKCFIPGQFIGKSQRQAVLSAVQFVFGGVEFDEHKLM